MPDPVPQVPNTPTPAANPLPAPSTPLVPQPEAPSSKGMVWVILAAFLVVAALAGAGIYLYMGMRETNPAFQQVSESVHQSLDSAANDLSGVQEEDISQDFAEVDKELNSL